MNDEQLQEQVPETPETEAQVDETPIETPENPPETDPVEEESGSPDVDMDEVLTWAEVELRKRGYKVERDAPKQEEVQVDDDESYMDEEGFIDTKKMESVLQSRLLKQLAPILVAPLTQSVLAEGKAILGSIPSAMEELEATLTSLPPDKLVAISQMDKSARELAFLKLYHQHSVANEKPKGTSSSFGTATPAPTGTTQMSQYVRDNLDRWMERFPHLTRNEAIEKLKNIEEGK